MSNNSDAVIAAARGLIAETLQKQTLQRALREGVTVRGGMASAAVTCTPDPALLERTRAVVQGDVVRIEVFDGEAWREVYRAVASDSSAPAAETILPEEPSSPFGPTQPGQLVVTEDGRFAIAK
jgi:hypothetical protein